MQKAVFEPRSHAAVVLISGRFGHSGGGEAIKAQQYADYLLRQGYELRVLTHVRSQLALGAELSDDKLWLIDDTLLQKILWRLPPLRPFLEVYFHLVARRIIRQVDFGRFKPILHYISPVSPVALRFPVRGFPVVIGPMTGNIFYPPGFRDRMSVWDWIRERGHNLAQILFGRVMGDKKAADILLVSGYERTRASLRVAGCPEAKMIDVVDSGVNEQLQTLPRIKHAGKRARFMCSGRMVDHKGFDLAIRAVAGADPEVTLDIYGDGAERSSLEALVTELALRDRVTFKGWLPSHTDLIGRFADYRGYLFPSLAEANGIVMQEAMMVGLPVVAIRWGGPAMLADDMSAIYIEPENQAHVVDGLARAMNRLASDGDYADEVSRNARAIAQARFTWAAVAQTWQKAYEGFMNRADGAP